MSGTAADPSPLVALTANIVSAYVTRHDVPQDDLPSLINRVHLALAHVGEGKAPASVTAATREPAVNPKKSIFNDFIICLEDGKKFKSLKRHLRSRYNLTPEAYREKWGLPPDYPMVAPAYAKARSALAKKMGLGQQRRAKR